MSNKTRKIKDVCQLNGERFKRLDSSRFVNYLDTGSITRNTIEGFQLIDVETKKLPSRAQRGVKDKTIIYSTVRPNQEHFGIIENPPNNLVVSTGFTTLDVKDEEIDPHYLYFFLSQKNITNYLHTIAVNNVSAYPSINPDTLGDLEVNFPETLEEQRKVVKVLTLIEKKIKNNNLIISSLNSYAKLIYEYWFVQFEFPNDVGKPYKSSGGKMVWDALLNKEIPDGWKSSDLSELISIEKGVSYSTPDLADAGLPMINLNSFSLSGEYKFDGIKYLKDTFTNTRRLAKGDLLVSVTDVTRNADITGKAFILPDIFNAPPVASCDVVKIEVDESLDKFYLEMLFNSEPYHQYIKGFATGTLVLHLNTQGIEWYKCLIPNKNLLNQFSQIKEIIELKKSAVMIETHKLSQLKDWLLPMFMNGQVALH